MLGLGAIFKRSVTLEIPVFGKVVRSDWRGLLMFRQFPFLRQFGESDPRSADGQPCINHLDKKEREAVENWKNPTQKLARICNNGCVSACLHSWGVFALKVESPDDGMPTSAQEIAYQEFVVNEEKVCATLMDALIRYYQLARQTQTEWFDWMDPEDLVENPDAITFAKLASLHGMTVCRSSAKGVSPLLFSWSPIWEEEHGFQTIMYNGQVIMMGTDACDLVAHVPNIFLKQNEEYGIWGINQMTKIEKDALDEFVSNLEPARDLE
ncbi:MAG: hypothetical protein AAB370_00900 [Verrucomicrobiota bacterium]